MTEPRNLWLPPERPADAQDALSARSTHAAGDSLPDGTATSLRVLLVEDDPLIQLLMVETLAFMGHTVCAVADTEDGAIEAAAQTHPDLMIVDWRLETGSGLAAVRQILRTGPIPYIFVSGDALIMDQLEAGAVALQKPFQENDLARAIARAMRVRPLQA